MSEESPAPAPLRLVGAPNFRDLGGLPVEGGRRTRKGVFHRSSGLEELTEQDVALLRDRVGLRTIVDLRTPDEIASDGLGPLGPPQVGYRNLPITNAAGALSAERPLDASGRTDVPQVFLQYLDASAESFLGLFELLATPDALPAIVHCAAGKDRTGVAVAMVLRAVGVTVEAVVADFCVTGAHLDDIIAYLSRRPSYSVLLPQLPRGTMDAEPGDIRAFLVALDERYGGPAAWLRGVGVEEATLRRVADLLVEPDDAGRRS